METKNIIYIEKGLFHSVCKYMNGTETASRESLDSTYKNLNNKTFVRIRKYIINIECINRVKKNEVYLNNGVCLKLRKKDMDTIRWAVHHYCHDRLH